jgi:hypothetical protein
MVVFIHSPSGCLNFRGVSDNHCGWFHFLKNVLWRNHSGNPEALGVSNLMEREVRPEKNPEGFFD